MANVSSGYISKAVLNQVKVSPRRARLVADLIRGKRIEEALDLLICSDKKTAGFMKKLLMSAVANADNQSDVDVDELVVKRVWVDAGQTIKRFMPRAQGRATPIRKRHSRITIELDEK